MDRAIEYAGWVELVLGRRWKGKGLLRTDAHGFLMILLVGIWITGRGLAQKLDVAVITTIDVEAYAQTLGGIREQFPDAQVWDARNEARLRESLSKKLPALAIAVGSGAAAELERLAPAQLTLVKCAVLEADLEGSMGEKPRFRTAVTVDLPPETLLSWVVRMFPGRSRVGVIRGPMQTDAYMKSFERAARKNGLTIDGIICQQPRDVVEVFLRFKSHVDLVWCPPDAQLYNSATLKPLLIASLTNRLPIIGFSEHFVQAGALFGGSADFAEVGRQTAALAGRIARNEHVPSHEGARKFTFAYNQRVARLLGVKSALPERSAGELTIIR